LLIGQNAFSFGGSFHDFDFVGGESAKVIDQGVNLAVEAVAAICRGKLEFLVGPKIRDKLHHPRERFLKVGRHGEFLHEEHPRRNPFAEAQRDAKPEKQADLI
jgi:hypothetical protein